MATKTTSATDNNAGCSPCTPEAHQRTVFRAFFTFKNTHTDRHYLVNPRAKKYMTAISRESADAFLFKTEHEARKAMDKLLQAWDYGRGGYYYCSGVDLASVQMHGK